MSRDVKFCKNIAASLFPAQERFKRKLFDFLENADEETVAMIKETLLMFQEIKKGEAQQTVARIQERAKQIGISIDFGPLE